MKKVFSLLVVASLTFGLISCDKEDDDKNCCTVVLGNVQFCEGDTGDNGEIITAQDVADARATGLCQ